MGGPSQRMEAQSSCRGVERTRREEKTLHHLLVEVSAVVCFKTGYSCCCLKCIATAISLGKYTYILQYVHTPVIMYACVNGSEWDQIPISGVELRTSFV